MINPFVVVDSDDDSSDESSTTSDSSLVGFQGEPRDIEAQQQKRIDIGGQDSVGVSL
jgi:hypothetical protein